MGFFELDLCRSRSTSLRFDCSTWRWSVTGRYGGSMTSFPTTRLPIKIEEPPRTRTDAGSVRSRSACANERAVRGRPGHTVDGGDLSDTDLAASPIAAPIWVRSRPEVLAPPRK